MSVYKGEKLVAGGSIDTHFVRKPAWDQAVTISVASMLTGYKVPADGMIVGLLFTNGNTSTGVSIKVNGVEIARNKAKDSDRILNVQCLVNKDNVITITGDDTTTTSSGIRFVPFEDSTVSESDVEVVTPELIRNLHDPDWSQAIPIRTPQLAEGYTVPKRGIVVGSFIPKTDSGTEVRIIKIKINDIVASYTRAASNEITQGSVQCPVCAYDVIKLEGIAVENCDAHFSFVPYKAQ